MPTIVFCFAHGWITFNKLIGSDSVGDDDDGGDGNGGDGIVGK